MVNDVAVPLSASGVKRSGLFVIVVPKLSSISKEMKSRVVPPVNAFHLTIKLVAPLIACPAAKFASCGVLGKLSAGRFKVAVSVP